jgi:Spy/CpxP family protein refolding chaperone
MMVKRFLGFIPAAVMVIALGASPALAHEGGDGHDKGCGKGHHEEMAKIELTQAQKDQIKAIAEKNKPTIEPLAKSFFTERRALEGMTSGDKVDDAAIRAQVAKIAPIEADFMVAKAHELAEMRGVLTADQIGKIGGPEKLDRFLMGLARRGDKCHNE